MTGPSITEELVDSLLVDDLDNLETAILGLLDGCIVASWQRGAAKATTH